MPSFDPYHKWLGIPPQDQPPNHYRMLGIALFESDLDVIDASASRQAAYLQGCATGPHVALSQKLLNEIAAARLCLLNPQKKAEYDKQLRANQTPPAIPSVSENTPIHTRPWFKKVPWTFVGAGGVVIVIFFLVFGRSDRGDKNLARTSADPTPSSAVPTSTIQPKNDPKCESKVDSKKPKQTELAAPPIIKPMVKPEPIKPQAKAEPKPSPQKEDAKEPTITNPEPALQPETKPSLETAKKPRTVYTQVDISSQANYSWLPGYLPGAPKGNVTLGGIPFNIASNAAGNQGWSAQSARDDPDGHKSITIPVNVYGVTDVYTLINTIYGQRGPNHYAWLTFTGSGGATYTKNLIGDIDIRDYCNGSLTNAINGKTAVNVFTCPKTNNGQWGRLDMQHIVLPDEFAVQTLKTIKLVDNGKWGFQRVVLDGVTVVVVPKEESASEPKPDDGRPKSDVPKEPVSDVPARGETKRKKTPQSSPPAANTQKINGNDSDHRRLTTLLKKKLHGRVAYNSKTGELVLTYDWTSRKQLDDFDLAKAEPVLMRGTLALRPEQSIRHVVNFRKVTIAVPVLVPIMRGMMIRTSGGAQMYLGGLDPNGMYLNDGKGQLDRIVPENQRKGIQQILVTLEENHLEFKYGNGNSPSRLGKAVTNFHAGQVELFGGEAGFQYGTLTFAGTLDDNWVKKLLADSDSKK